MRSKDQCILEHGKYVGVTPRCYRKAKPFMKDIAMPSSMAKLNVILHILQSFWQKMKAKKWNLDAFLDKLLCGFHRVSASIVLFMTLYETCNCRGGKAYFVTANKEFWMELTCAFLEKNPIPDLCIQCCIVTQKSEPNSLKADPIWTNCMVAKHISLEVPSAVRSIESNIWKDDFITAPNSSLLEQKGSMDI